MIRRSFWVLFAFSLLVSSFFLQGSSCSRNLIQCRFSNDCPGKMICGTRGFCVSQCKVTRDCHQNFRCLEGICQELGE